MGSSPSFFNIEEIVAVKELVTAIHQHAPARIAARDIGVISPYARQCERLRRTLEADFSATLKVGQPPAATIIIIIITTVIL